MNRTRYIGLAASLFVMVTACGKDVSDVDANVSVDFSCGAFTCHSATQFCWYERGGDFGDAGAALVPYCNDYGTVCASDRTCGCLVDAGFSCPSGYVSSCSQDGSAITVKTGCM